ncbi:type I-U CRISPR-associated protein Csx17 [Rosistilla oblonga]|uniref:type I-G CRISPR-associated protein Cas8g1/Csx17 n=1 Tax=Rosistilla oblonga TaxID=2527990 RepID=UPI003A97120F
MTQQTLILHGCTPVPLAGYLKALGVLRIVSMQADPQTQGWWQHDVFHLRCSLSETELLEFFESRYAPTPLVAPWNGGSGFHPKDNTQAIEAIAGSGADRLSTYRNLLSISRQVLGMMSLTEKPDADSKAALLQLCRNNFPDNALDWLDAAFVLTNDGAKYPPLLGTGGNDGRLEFTNNYMQRVVELFDLESGKINAAAATPLADALWGTCVESRSKAAIGQFDPGSAGGANSGTGYDAAPTMNIWDFVLMLEGAIAFAGSSVRKLETTTGGSLAYPFCVRPAGIGYGSSDLSDEESSRSEMWMPLWTRPASFDSISHLLSEGRIDIGKRRARNGVDFARAIASVGVDRGLDSFQRFGFQQRNGLAYFAVPLGRFNVSTPSTIVSLLGTLDHWLDRFRRTATGKNSTATAAASLRKLESAIINTCQQNDSSGQSKDSGSELLIALGVANATIAASPKLREADYPVSPVPLLSPQWLQHCYAPDSPHAREFRLAASLASIGFGKHSIGGPLRQHLEPIDVQMLTNKRSARASWAKHPDDPAIVWSNGNLVRNLVAVLQRRLIDVSRSNGNEFISPISGRCPANLDDVSAFLNQETDDRAIESLLRGLTLIDWNRVAWEQIPWMSGDPKRDFERKPSAAWCLLKLCLLPDGVPSPDGLAATQIRLQPQIFRLAANGKLAEATALASQRLRSSGLRTAVETIYASANIAARTTAALMFPIYGNPNQHVTDITRIRDQVLFKSSREESGSADTVVRGNSM